MLLVLRTVALVLSVLGATSVKAGAESIPMANGSKLEGEFVAREGDLVTLRVQGREFTVPKRSVDEAWLAKQMAPLAENAAIPPTPSKATEAVSDGDRIRMLEARIAALEQQVSALRTELALSRSRSAHSTVAEARPVSTAEPLVASTPAPARDAAAKPAATSVPTETGFWLSAGSGVRHNRNCRYYMKSKGGHCRADEGRACTKCGG